MVIGTGARDSQQEEVLLLERVSATENDVRSFGFWVEFGSPPLAKFWCHDF